MKYEQFVCDCRNNDHSMVFTLDEQENELSVDYRMNQYLSFWKRIKVAIKYIFNKENDFRPSHWDNIIFQQKDTERLQNLLNKHTNPCHGLKAHHLTIETSASAKDLKEQLENLGLTVDSIRTTKKSSKE